MLRELQPIKTMNRAPTQQQRAALGPSQNERKVVVKPVSTRAQRRAFLEFPWTLYRDDPNWIPPLRSDQKEMVGFARHPFYERNRAQAFLAYRGDEICGRIVAIVNVEHIQRYNDPRGFFECRNDQEAASASV